MATYTLKDLWIKACKHDGIEPDSKFVVFDKANPWAVKYNRLALLIAQAPRIPNQPSERPLSYRTRLASDIEMINYELAKCNVLLHGMLFLSGPFTRRDWRTCESRQHC